MKSFFDKNLGETKFVWEERESPAFKETVKVTITPLLSSLALLQYVDIDTEEEMLGYGIGIILLNIGVYFVASAVIILKFRKSRI